MRKPKKLIAFVVMLLTVMVPASTASADTETNFYTYNYDYYGVQYETPDAYTAEDMLMGIDLGKDIGDFKNPLGMFIKDENIYIADSGNNRIVEVDKNFQLVRVISKVTVDGQDSPLKNPQDVFVAANDDIYICDSDNFRVLHLDKDLNVIKIYTKPAEALLTDKQNFIPLKGVVDTAGRLYVMAANVNKGFMEFDETGKFTGFIGANRVKVSFFEVMQKRLMTKAQRQRMELFVPTEYSNVAIDQDNFLYATTTTNSGDPIRKINSLGNDILIKNGYYDPTGEIWYDDGGDIKGPSRFQDITSLDNDTYFAVDRTRGRIFGYDFQGNLLYAFGGVGNKFGYFTYPVAIDHMGSDLFVLDSKSATVTRFTLTEYGSLINNGLKEYKLGRYDESSKYWEQVLHFSGNYDLAYIGIGRALLRQEKYGEAMKYFKAKNDFDNYSKAFIQYRKEWVETNIGYIITVIIALIVLPKLIRFIRKLVKGEVFK